MSSTPTAAEASAQAELARFRRHNRWLFMAATGVIGLIVVVMALTLAIVAHWRLNHPELIARLALTWSPSIFYLWALWTLRGLFAALAKDGLRFQPRITTALSRIGWALMSGSVLTLVTAPVIIALTHPVHPGWFATFDAPALTLCMLGLALAVLARMLKRAITLEAEAASMKHVLEGFI